MNARGLSLGMPAGSLLLLVMFVLVLMTALGVAYTQHWNRLLLNDLYAELSVRDRALAEWGRLVLEQSTWTSHARIETLATGQLGMRVPAAVDVQLVSP
ncbi:cell division protein FtsL [Atopomonas sediminilitoris]|uniref:cell division protein FtsL n=1 Tax=Atopomonas sediminilitoris TaxID=2919919 RepID=UPI001F4E2099|nr:cell division protein FtsL [Atopomonas sediminilitoris]MCJ8170688.1 cell division protein FtsL [Atopomonas sediminilitoris]